MNPILFHNFSGRDAPDYSRTSFDSMIVTGGFVSAIGFGLEKVPAPLGVQRMDLGGMTLLPAFADAHVHFLQTGFTFLGCRLETASCLEDVFEVIRTHAARSNDEWILGWNLDETLLDEGRLPTVKELDAAIPNRKVWLSRIDLHSAVPNSRTVEWARKVRPVANLHRDYYFREDYIVLCSRLMESLPLDMKKRGLEIARRRCLTNGITTVHALEGGWASSDEEVQLVSDFLENDGFHGVVYHQSEDPALALKNRWPRLGGCLMVDGSFGSRTAALSAPYEDDPSTNGVLYRNTDALEPLIGRCSENGLQLAMHAIGDRAIDKLASAYARGVEKYGAKTLPNRIEHFELPSERAIAQVRDTGTLLSVQPAFETLWGGSEKMYSLRLGSRAANTNPFRTLLKLGIPLAGGSDSPVTSLDPFLGLHGFLNHPTFAERIDLNSALAAFIVEPHRFAGEERTRGHLRPGFFADFVCLREDPFLVPAGKIRDLRVSRVFVKGQESQFSGSQMKTLAKTNMLFALFVLFAFFTGAVSSSGLSQPLPAGGIALENDAFFTPFEEVKPLVEDFLNSLGKEDTGIATMKLFEIFPIGAEAKDSFSKKITALKTRLGPPAGCELVGYRRFGKSQRYVVVYYFSLHNVMPVLWEFTFYRPQAQGNWQLNFIRFESDDLVDFLGFTRMQYEALRQQLDAPSQKQAPTSLPAAENAPEKK